MRFHELTAMLEEGEGLTVEFKRKVSSPEKIAREMIAFANTRGGTVIFGIDDDKSVVGVESEKSEMEDIRVAAEVLSDPPLPYALFIFQIESRDIICVRIPESEHKPHYLCSDAGDRVAYVRVGEKSIQASKEMVRVLRHQYGASEPVRLIVGEAEKRLFAWFERNERITVREYAKLINVSDRRATRLLVRLVRAGALAIHTDEKTDYFTQM